jgi:ATP-dependent Clp protease ATP-binding subunit ClpX
MSDISTCNFCTKTKDQVLKLIVGDDAAICNECVNLCSTLLVDTKKTRRNKGSQLKVPDPRAVCEYLDQHVVGQRDAKRVLSVAIVNHYKRISNPDPEIEIQKANILMLGPTGTGKTLMARTVARYLNVPFVIADATTLTEAGYVGDDVESLISRLYIAANGDVEQCERGIVFLDEIDKIARKSESSTVSRDVSGEGVQQALLKLIEGTRCRISPQGSRRTPSTDTVEIDTTNILFIGGGAFVGLDQIVKTRVQGTAMGFGATLTDANADAVPATPDDLVRYGLIPEFVGRFSSTVSLQGLSKAQLIDILTSIKNNFIAQYKWLFEQDGVSLDFDQDSLELIADRTLRSKTGARGLHTELERVLLPHMFDLPRYSKQNIIRVVINKEQVNTPMTLAQENE